MRLLFINLVTYSKVGGIENYNKTVIKALEELNISFDVLSIYDDKEYDLKNGKYYICEGSKRKALKFILINNKKYDIVFASHINLLPLLMIFKILNKEVKLFLSAHGIEVWKKFPFYKSFFLNKYVTILPVSTYTKRIMQKLNNLHEERFKILFNSVFFNVNNENDVIFLDKEDKSFNLLSVSRLDKNDNYKGIDSVIKTLPLLINKIPNIKYIIIGKGNDKERLENLAKQLGVDKYVFFQGFVENIDSYYKNCNLFILPSKGEGFGIVYLEAMQYKKPCIACNEGGQTDVVIDNKTGYLCKYNDLNCLKEKILDLYKNEDKRIRFGENGYKHLLNNFTFEKFKQNLEKILKEV